MHYYTFNIGDYRRDTAHLSRLEHSIYRDLIDWYYLDEKPIPKETQMVSRRLRLGSEDEKKALQNVLDDFFEVCEDGYRHSRIEAGIEEFHQRTEKNKKNGKKGGRPSSEKTQWVILGSEQKTQSEPNRTLTNNQEPITNIQMSGSTSIPTTGNAPPDCPHAEILTLWANRLPSAIQPSDWNEKRQQALRSRWREKKNRQDLDWWARLFDYISESDFLMGRVTVPNRKTFSLSLDWLCKPDNFLKVIEGTYHEAKA